MSQLNSGTVVETLEEFKISPPPASVPAISLPLTFFDLQFLITCPAQRVFFYDSCNCSSPSQFRQTLIPNLADSLSLTLRHFFPLASRLISPPRPSKPHILFSGDDGYDSVLYTVAQTETLDFHQLTSFGPNDAVLLHPLLPKLPPPDLKPDGTTVSPLLAVKVTFFPKSGGICIGFEFHHVAADGMAFNHFVKSWAAISKSGAEELDSPPCHDRSLIKGRKGLEDMFLENFWNFSPNSIQTDQLYADKVRATFAIDSEEISRLKSLVSKESPPSKFAVTSGFVWSNIIKSLEPVDGETICSYLILADCRGRIDPPLPPTYFGNCLGGVHVSMKRKELVGDGGFVAATEAIAAEIKEMEAAGALRDAEKWLSVFEAGNELGKVVIVAGSPKLRVYETDFGWGRPVKSEPVHVDVSTGIYYLSDRRDEENGGLEFGLALSKAQMDGFVSGFERLTRVTSSYFG
ncbi:Coumaroyl-CoA:anthocyanidin 3-O-glucoside-6''-O-coumaroyltransferase 1 [Linum perenne]